MLSFPHERNKPLSEVSTFGIGGPARFYAEAHSHAQMEEMVRSCLHHSVPFFILGKGSNCLFDDKGFNGLVIRNRIDFLHQEDEKFSVGAGYSFARLGGQTARLGWSGLEFASGIPATVGGAIFMNAGANGQETGDKLLSVDYLTDKGELLSLKKEEMTFGYRSSSFQKRKGVILSALFSLEASPHAKEQQKKILEYRLETQPYGEKSAGCAFRNPLAGSAGKLIDGCGLKGLKIGGAQISSLHANFIVNGGKATAQEVLELMKIIKELVYEKTGVLLEDEVRIIPYECP